MADEPKGDGQGQQGATGGEQSGGKEVPFNEHPRWKEVYGELQEFKKAGVSPGDLAARLQEAEELKAAFAEAIELARQEDAKKHGDQVADANFQQARAWVKQLIAEELTDVSKIGKLEAAINLRNQRLERAATSETKKLMTAAGLDVSEKEVATMSDTLADIIKNDPELFDDYEIDPRGAVRGAYEKFVKKFKTVGERAAKAASQRQREDIRSLPKAHGPGGGDGGGAKAAGPPKTIAEATARVAERLRGANLEDL